MMQTALKIRILSSLERPPLASGAGVTTRCIFDLLHWSHEAYRGPACFGTFGTGLDNSLASAIVRWQLLIRAPHVVMTKSDRVFAQPGATAADAGGSRHGGCP